MAYFAVSDCTDSSCFGFVSSGLQAVAKYSFCSLKKLVESALLCKSYCFQRFFFFFALLALLPR